MTDEARTKIQKHPLPVKRALTDDQVRQARVMHRNGWSLRMLEKEFHLSFSTIQKIVRRETYRNVRDEDDEKEEQMRTVVSFNTHPLRGTVSAEEREALIVEHEDCTLCRAARGQRCRVYQTVTKGKPGARAPEVGKERSPHRRRVSAAFRHGLL